MDAPDALRSGYWFDKDATIVVLPTGRRRAADRAGPYYQIAMASRSLHRSQDMGTLQEPGPERRPARSGWTAARAGAARISSPASTRACARSPADVADPARRAQDREAPRRRRGAELRKTRRTRLDPEASAPRSRRSRDALRSCARPAPSPRPGDGGAADAPRREDRARRSRARRRRRGHARRARRDARSPRRAKPSRSRRQRLERRRRSGRGRVASSLESPDGWTVEPAAGAGARRRAGTARGVEAPRGRSRRRAADDPLLSRSGRCAAISTTGARRPRPCAASPSQPRPLTAVARAARSAGRACVLAREVTFRLRDEAIGEIRRPVARGARARRRRRARLCSSGRSSVAGRSGSRSR